MAANGRKGGRFHRDPEAAPTSGWAVAIALDDEQEVLQRRPAPGLGQAMLGWRKDKGLTLREAAEQLGVAFTYLQKVETGGRARAPKLLLLQRMAAVYDVPTAEVFAVAGITPYRLEDARASIDRAFLRLVMHERLRPDGMSNAWADSFSTKQKRQWIEFAQRLQALLADPDDDVRDVEEIVRGVPGYPEEGDDE